MILQLKFISLALSLWAGRIFYARRAYAVTMKPSNTETMKTALCAAGALGGLCLLICFSAQANTAMRESLSMCAAVMVPSLFPMMTVSGFLSACPCPAFLRRRCAAPLRALFGLSPGCLTPLLLGLTGGYPLAAKAAAEASEAGVIAEEDARRLTLFFTCPGLPFAVVAAGDGFFGSRTVGITLFVACAVADASAAFLWNRLHPAGAAPAEAIPQQRFSPGQALVRAVERAVSSMLSVCAWICAFGTLLAVVNALAGDGLSRRLPLIAEITAAVRTAAEQKDLPLTAACLAFGGLCLMCQLLPELQRCGAGAARYLAVRSVCAGLAWLTETVLLRLFAVPVPTDSRLWTIPLSANSVAGSAALLFCGAVFMAETARLSSVGAKERATVPEVPVKRKARVKFRN